MAIHQHAALEGTVYFWFASNDTSGSGNDGASAAADVRLAGAAASAAPVLSPTPSLLTDAGYPAGCYEVAVAATTGNGFAAGSTYAVFCTLAVDSQNPSGFVGSFTLDPILANITEISDDATAATNMESFFDGTGYAGTGNTIPTVTTVTNQVTADVTAISGDATAADNCEAFFDGTGYAGTNNVIPTVTNVTNQVTADVTAVSGDTVAADNLELFFDGTGYNAANSTVGNVTLVATTTTVTNQVTADVTAISGDTTAADNLESDYDGTGYNKTASAIATVQNVTNQVTADMTAISGDSVAADNLEAILDGTGGTGLNLSALVINANRGGGAVDIDNTGGPGVQINGTTYGTNVVASAGPGARISGTTMGLRVDGGASGYSIWLDNGTYDDDIAAVLSTFDETTDTVDVGAISGDTAAADNLELFFDGTGYDAANSTVGNVTLVATTTDVTNQVSADVTAISGDGPAADNLEADYDGTGYNKSASTIGTATTVTNNVTVGAMTAAALADFFDTDSGTTYGSAVAGSVVKEIADNAGGSGLTLNDIADAVWDEPLAGHTTNDTPGKVINMLTQDAVTLSTEVELASIFGQLLDNGTAWSYDRTTDSLEAVRDRGDAAWITATDVNVTSISGDSGAADNLEAFFDGTGYNAANSTVGNVTLVATTTDVTNQVSADVTAISGDGPAADNLELFFDGTGYAAANSTVGTVTTVTNSVTVGAMTAAALADFFDTDSGTTYGAAVAGSVVKEIADNAGGSGLTLADIADAVWDEQRSGHTAGGSFGEGVASVQGNVTGSVASVTGNVGGNVVGSVGSVSTTVSADVVSISGDATAADNLEAILDGTGGTGLTLNKLTISANDAAGAIDIDNSGGPGISTVGTTYGMYVESTALGGVGLGVTATGAIAHTAVEFSATSGDALSLTGERGLYSVGSLAGALFQGPVTGYGIYAAGGAGGLRAEATAAGGAGIYAHGLSGDATGKGALFYSDTGAGAIMWGATVGLLVDGTSSGYSIRLDNGTYDADIATVLSTFDETTDTVDVGAISGDSTAADNLELFFDGTGYDAANSTVGNVTLVATTTDVTNQVSADVTAISGDATAADNLEAILDGTGAVMTLTQLRINSSAAGGAIDIDNSGGPAVSAVGTTYGLYLEASATGGYGAYIEASDAISGGTGMYIGGYTYGLNIAGTGPTTTGAYISGAGTGPAVQLIGGNTAVGLYSQGGTGGAHFNGLTSGYSIRIDNSAYDDDIANVLSTFDETTDTVDVGAISGDTAAADNLELFFDGTGYDAANSTVGNVTLVATTTTVTNQVTADVTAISGDSAAADNLEADYDGTGYNKTASTIGTATTIGATGLTAINAEVADVMTVDTLSAITQQAPPNTPTFEEAIMYLYSALTEEVVVDVSGSPDYKEFKTTGGSVAWKKQVTDGSSIYTEAAGVSGP